MGFAYDVLRKRYRNRKQHRCERFQQDAAGNSEPAHNTCLIGSSASNRLIITPADYGNEPDGPNRGKCFESDYAAAALSGAIFLSPSKDAKFYASGGAMQCDAAGADKGDTKAGARTRRRADSP